MRNSFRLRVILYSAALVTLCLAAFSAYIYSDIRASTLESFRANLHHEVRMVALQSAAPLAQGLPNPQLSQLMAENARLTGARITIILPDGSVAAETWKDPADLDNHANRPEFIQALAGQENDQIRYSATLKKDLLYVAAPVLYQNQVIAVARLAVLMDDVNQALSSVLSRILTAAALTGLVVILLASLMAATALRPLLQLTQAVQAISQGRQKNIQPSARQDEVGQLSRAFNHLTTQLNNQLEALSTERSKLEIVLNQMSDGVVIVNESGQVLLSNPAAARMFEADLDAQPANPTLIEIVRSHHLVDLWQRSHAAQEPKTLIQEIIPERLFVQATATPLGAAMPGCTLMVFTDITRLRRLETVRRDFVSNVSHELRTPLASLKALTETLDQGALEDPPAARRFLSRMDQEIDNLIQLVQEFLELSRIESGRVPLERSAVFPQHITAPAVERMHLQAERAGLTLEDLTPTDLPTVLADSTRLQQVLVNLIHNAVKFTQPGGKVQVGAYSEGQQVVFYVCDTGVGIAPDSLNRIFERFYKADRARSGGGTGLGLSIARHLVELHGGRIWADSVQSQGSTFYFSLPTA